MGGRSRSGSRWVPYIVGGALAAAVGAAAVVASRPNPPKPVGPDRGTPPTELTGRDGPLSFEIREGSCGYDNVISSEGKVAADGQFCSVVVDAVQTLAGEPRPFDLGCQSLLTRDRQRYPVDREATLSGVDPAPFERGLPPDEPTQVELTFDIPDEAEGVGVELHASCGSPGARLAFPSEDGGGGLD